MPGCGGSRWPGHISGAVGVRVTGATQVAAVIGDPVTHSLSPTLHNAGFAHTGLDWVYVALPVRAGTGRSVIEAMRTLGLAGMNVTMPHKDSVAEACDALSATAARLGAVNTVVWHGDALVGHSTDGPGLVAALQDLGVAYGPDRPVLVVGAGGAARAAVYSLGQHDVPVSVAARREEPARLAAELAPLGRAVGWPDTPLAAQALLDDHALVINAIPLGMGDRDRAHPFERLRWREDQVLYDMVYWPAETSLIRDVRARGGQAHNGLSMLIHQAALAFELWTGVPAPVEVMTEAGQSALLERARRAKHANEPIEASKVSAAETIDLIPSVLDGEPS